MLLFDITTYNLYSNILIGFLSLDYLTIDGTIKEY